MRRCVCVQARDELHEYSLQGLDRIAQPITGQHLLGTLWPLIEEWSKSGEWQRRHAALLTIAQVAEGCCKARRLPALLYIHRCAALPPALCSARA